MSKPLVTKDMTMGDILRRYPSSVYALIGCGLGCVSCPSSEMETLEEAAAVHGLKQEEVLAFLNDWIAEKESGIVGTTE
ncbi:MAG: DUF1858 domain-containing protein [Clostridia bacterium]|nr:DUF1858 domain-containing protein [Clostridia bacterium]